MAGNATSAAPAHAGAGGGTDTGVAVAAAATAFLGLAGVVAVAVLLVRYVQKRRSYHVLRNAVRLYEAELITTHVFDEPDTGTTML